ncbi:MAG: response regulator [Patescibacteria group bacterium]|jgi:CheY-like chemotaxis protein
MDTKKILIAEDEASIRQAVLDAFKEVPNVSIIVAQNGQQALDLAKSERPDLILLDVIMPKMHGVDMLENLQLEPWGKAIPVILLTNYADDPKVVRAVAEGRCELMKKFDVRLQDIVAKAKEKLKL